MLSAYGDRVAELAPYVAKLKRQTKSGRLPKTVTAEGTVRFPGEYPLIDGMSVGDLIEWQEACWILPTHSLQR